jgi:hypothetical protein
MTEKPPAFLLSCREADARELGVPVFDPNIETIAPPRLKRLGNGTYDEVNAASYLSYRGLKCSLGSLRRWRAYGQGPLYSTGPMGRPVWYEEVELDKYLERCRRDHSL